MKVVNFEPTQKGLFKYTDAQEIKDAINTNDEILSQEITRAQEAEGNISNRQTTVELGLAQTNEVLGGKLNEIFNTLTLADGLGTFNATTGIARITETNTSYTPTPDANQPNGKYFDVIVAGTTSITGTPVNAQIGGVFISRGTKWDYIPPSDAALSKVLALEGKAAISVDAVTPVTIISANVDVNMWCLQASYSDGTFYPPYAQKLFESYQLSASLLSRIDEGKYTDKSISNALTVISDVSDIVASAILSDGYPYPPLISAAPSASATLTPGAVGIGNLSTDVLTRIDQNKVGSGNILATNLAPALLDRIDQNKFTEIAAGFAIFGNVDSNNYFLSGDLSDGYPYPPAPSKGAVITPFVEPSIAYTAFDLLPADRNFPNAILNQWVEPTVVTRSADKSMYMSGIGTGLGAKGELWLGRKKPGGTWERRVAARIRSVDDSDDHNAIAILIDERPGAAYPLILFQSEHGSHQARMCRLTSWEPSEWNFAWTNISGSQASYAQAFRYGDEIIFHFRSQSTYTGFTGRSINWLYSSNNGNTWTERRIFAKDTEVWPYLLLKEKADKSGINIAINTHPIESPDKGIYFLELNWATGAIINPSDRIAPVVANFRTIFSNPQTVPIQPFAGGVSLMLYTTAGDERKRMWDISRSNSGDCLIFYTSTPDDKIGMATFNAAKNRVISFNLDTGIKNFDIVVSEAGMPNERPVGNNLYFSGGCIINNTKVLSFVYKNQSMIDGGAETYPSDGKSVAYIIDISNTSAPVSRSILTSKYKLMRPEISSNGEYVIFCEASRYITFKDYVCNQSYLQISELL